MGKTTGTIGGLTHAEIIAQRELSANATEAAANLLPFFQRAAEGENFGVERVIGPAEAEFLLSANPANRKIGTSKVLQFASDMRHGKWKFNGEPIIIARTGELNDGQHRLQAIMTTGLPQRMAVWFGVERDTRDTVDIGAVRTTGHHLQMKGFKYATVLAATARLVISYENANGRGIGRTSIVSSLEQQERVENDQLLREIVVYVEKHKPSFIRTSLLSMAFYVLARISIEDAKAYVDKIMTGVGLSATDPAYVVRERLMKDHSTRRGTASERTKKGLTEQGIIEVIFRGWNYVALGNATSTKVQSRGSLPLLRSPKTPSAVSDADTEPQVSEDESFVPYEGGSTSSRELEAA